MTLNIKGRYINTCPTKINPGISFLHEEMSWNLSYYILQDGGWVVHFDTTKGLFHREKHNHLFNKFHFIFKFLAFGLLRQ